MTVLKIIYTFLAILGRQQLYHSVFGLVAAFLVEAQDESSLDILDTSYTPNLATNGDDNLLSWRKSDHLECDVTKLGLSDKNLKQIYAIMNSDNFKRNEIIRMSNHTGFILSPHLVYRYLNSVDFSDNYHGQRIEDAITNTIVWRDQFGITNIDTSIISSLVEKGVGYVTDNLDKYGRAIMYVKVGRNDGKEAAEAHQRLLMYTVERADKYSVAEGSGQFVAIVDLTDFSWSKCPSLNVIKDSIGLLKKHYPYRLGGVYIINGGTTFNFLWSMIKPILPKRALLKTFVVNKKDEYEFLVDKIGKENFENFYGGDREETQRFNIEKYFQDGLTYTTINNLEIEIL